MPSLRPLGRHNNVSQRGPFLVSELPPTGPASRQCKLQSRFHWPPLAHKRLASGANEAIILWGPLADLEPGTWLCLSLCRSVGVSSNPRCTCALVFHLSLAPLELQEPQSVPLPMPELQLQLKLQFKLKHFSQLAQRNYPAARRSGHCGICLCNCCMQQFRLAPQRQCLVDCSAVAAAAAPAVCLPAP